EVMEPGLSVDSVGDLQKHGEVLGAQVQPAVGATEVEGVGSKVSCRVLPKVALAFELARQDSEMARRSVAPRPDQRFAGCEADVRFSTEIGRASCRERVYISVLWGCGEGMR